MPNATISVYLTDDEYVKYIPKKGAINEKCKDMVKKEIAK
jgi:hypothetical protein